MTDQDRKEEVAAIMRQYDEVYRSGDLSSLRRIRHPNFVFTSSRGDRISNEQELSAFADGSSRIDELQVLESNVRMAGDTAIVLQEITLKGVWFGRAISGRFALTVTWTKSEQGWQVLADHASAIDS